MCPMWSWFSPLACLIWKAPGKEGCKEGPTKRQRRKVTDVTLCRVARSALFSLSLSPSRCSSQVPFCQMNPVIDGCLMFKILKERTKNMAARRRRRRRRRSKREAEAAASFFLARNKASMNVTISFFSFSYIHSICESRGSVWVTAPGRSSAREERKRERERCILLGSRPSKCLLTRITRGVSLSLKITTLTSKV